MRARQSTRELIYTITNTWDETEAETLLLGAAPAVYLGLELESAQCDPLGGGNWRGTARYIRINENEYTFDTTGGTAHITQSIATVNTYAPPGFVAPDFGGAIGVTEDRVEGTDVPAPKYDFTETHFFADATVTEAYRVFLSLMTGRWNNATFRTFAAGELCFMGATGSKRGDDKWGITYRFSASPNQSGLTVGSITGIDKQGWDYIWFRYGKFFDSGAGIVVQRPISAHVERVLYSGDFSGLLI